MRLPILMSTGGGAANHSAGVGLEELLEEDVTCEHQGADQPDDLLRQNACCREEFERENCDIPEDEEDLHSKDLTDGGEEERFSEIQKVPPDEGEDLLPKGLSDVGKG